MFRLLIRITIWLSRSLFKSEHDLRIENLALRQQLAIFKNKRPTPRIKDPDQAFWVTLRSSWPKWTNALILVKPDTVAKWHRKGFRLFWKWKSRTRKPGRPRISREIRGLILKMACENGWGAPRIHSELLKLGFDVNERTVSRYMPKRPTPPDALKRWMAFLRNHREVTSLFDSLFGGEPKDDTVYLFVRLSAHLFYIALKGGVGRHVVGDSESAKGAIRFGVLYVKGQPVVAESVHLFDDQRFEDLLGGHHSLAARLGIVETFYEIRVYELCDLRMRVDYALNCCQLQRVLMFDRRLDN